MLLLEDWTYYTYFFWFVSSCPTNIIIMNINITIMTPFFSGEGAKYKQNSIKEHTKHIHAKNDCFDEFF